MSGPHRTVWRKSGGEAPVSAIPLAKVEDSLMTTDLSRSELIGLWRFNPGPALG